MRRPSSVSPTFWTRIIVMSEVSFGGETTFSGDLGGVFSSKQMIHVSPITDGDGTFTVVRDTLTFRNRIRDGVNEWQDENPKNYD